MVVTVEGHVCMIPIMVKKNPGNAFNSKTVFGTNIAILSERGHILQQSQQTKEHLYLEELKV